MEQQLSCVVERARTGSTQRGISLIELMVSIAISLVVLSALVYIYVGSRGAYRSNEALARVQENGRFAMDLLVREIRQAGYAGCLTRGSTITDVRKNTTVQFTLGDKAVLGFEAGAGFTVPTTPSGLALKPGSDAIELSGLSGEIARIISPIDEKGLPNFKVDRNTNISNGDDMIVTNCNDGVLAARTNNQNADPVITASPGTNTNTLVGYGYQNRSIIARYERTRFFIARTSASLPYSLYRAAYESDGTPLGPAEPLVENIEDMDVLFGVDRNGDGSAEFYRTATQVETPPEGGAADWGNVVSVRLSLLARSTDNGAVLQSQPVFFRTASGTPDIVPGTSDRYFRQTFTSTIALRNRLP